MVDAHMLFTEAQGLKGDRPSGEFDRILNGIIDRLNVRIQGGNSFDSLFLRNPIFLFSLLSLFCPSFFGSHSFYRFCR